MKKRITLSIALPLTISLFACSGIHTKNSDVSSINIEFVKTTGAQPIIVDAEIGVLNDVISTIEQKDRLCFGTLQLNPNETKFAVWIGSLDSSGIQVYKNEYGCLKTELIKKVDAIIFDEISTYRGEVFHVSGREVAWAYRDGEISASFPLLSVCSGDFANKCELKQRGKSLSLNFPAESPN